MFGLETIVTECKDGDSSIKTAGFAFKNLAEIQQMMQNTTIDVIGVVFKKDSTPTRLKMKSGEERDKFNIQLADETGVSVPVTFWGEICAELGNKMQEGEIVAIRGVRVSEYQGRCLNASSSIQDVFFKPQHKRAQELLKWFKSKSTEEHGQNLRCL